MAWTEERKQQVIKMYQDADPTPETSTEICKDIAEEMEESANGIRMVLMQANVYVKKEAAKGKESTKGTGTGKGTKETKINALKELIQSKGKEPDEEQLSKLTGKLADYLVSVFS